MLREAALAIPAIRRLHQDRAQLATRVRDLLAERQRADSPFFYYNASFDPVETINRHAVPDLRPTTGYVTNFLGVLIDPKFFPPLLAPLAGQVEEIPIPANWHADIAEWGAALRSVELANGAFRAAELGCGWGCWLCNTGVAARARGLPVELIGVEGDQHHVQFALEALHTNGFLPTQVRIVHGIAGAHPGKALFPTQTLGGHNWGLEPVFGASEEQVSQAQSEGSHQVLDTFSLEEIAGEQMLNLLHIDIQGGEAEYIRHSRSAMQDLVAYLLVGTHSRVLEGEIIEVLQRDGWILEIERPCIFSVEGDRCLTKVDGVQGWRNPRLT